MCKLRGGRLVLPILCAALALAWPAGRAEGQSCERYNAEIGADVANASMLGHKGFQALASYLDTDGLIRFLGWKVEPGANSSRDVPIEGSCDPVTAQSRFGPISPPGAANASGRATAGSSGASSPMAFSGASALDQASIETVVGFMDSGFFTPYHAFRWTEATGPVDLGTLDPPNNASLFSFAAGVNRDGSVVVGHSQIAGGMQEHAFRWTAASGMVDLGAPAGAARGSRARGVSAAGDVVVGSGEFVDDDNLISGLRNGAFRWTAAGGFQSLGALEPGWPSIATAVNPDGNTIVGQGGVQVIVGGSSTNGSRAFRWTAQTGMLAIGPLPGHTHAVALGISDDGRIVVGTSSETLLSEGFPGEWGSGTAFRWTEAGGIQDLRQLMANAGVNMTGFTLLSATGISPDGQWITGSARTPTTPAGETSTYFLRLCDAAVTTPCPTLSGLGTPTFSFAVSGGSAVTVAAGRSVSATLTVTPIGGFVQPVTFACSGLPAGAACGFSPASLTPSGGAATITVTFTTGRAAAAVLRRTVAPSAPAAAFASLIGALIVLAATRSRRTPLGRLARGAACGALLLPLLSCGGSTTEPPETTGTPPGTYPVTITASSGSGATALSRTADIQLTVTP